MTSVLKYGADPTGQSDSTPAFLTALATETRVDFDAPGSYLISNAEIPSGRVITGVPGARLVMAPGQPAGTRMLRVRDVQDVQIVGLEIDGQGSTQTPSEQSKGIYIQNAKNVRLYDLRMHDVMGDCVSVYGTSTDDTTGGILIDRFTAWNQGRSAIVIHGVAPAEVALRDVSVSRGTPVSGTPTMVGLIDVEPSNPGLVRGLSFERVTVVDGAFTIGCSPSSTTRSLLSGLTLRNVSVRARAGNVGVSLARVYAAVIDGIEIGGEATVPFTLRDAGPGIVGELGRIIATGIKAKGAWSQDGIAVWTNGNAPPGAIILDSCEVEGVANNPNAGRSYFIGDKMADVSLYNCRSAGGAQGFAATGTSNLRLIGCEARGAASRSYRFRGGSPYMPASVYAAGCTADASAQKAVESVGDVTWDGKGIVVA